MNYGGQRPGRNPNRSPAGHNSKSLVLQPSALFQSTG